MIRPLRTILPRRTGLAPEHLRKLRGSDLHDETIASARLYTEADAFRLSKLLGGLPCRSIAPALVFQFFALSGEEIDSVVARPSRPRTTTDNAGKLKPVKYEAPRGRGSRAYFPPNAHDAINNP